MATTIRLASGGVVTLSKPPADDLGGPGWVRLEVYGHTKTGADQVEAIVSPDELATLTEAFLRRLTPAQQKVIADAFIRRALSAGAAGEEGGSPPA